MKKIYKIKCLIMVAAIITVCLSFQKSNAASLSIKSIKVAVGKKATINLYNNDGEVKWTSSNKKIKIVKKKSDKVTIKGVKEGKSTLIAQIGKKKLKCKVTITKKEIEKYEISYQNVYFEKNRYSEGGRFYAFIEITNTGNVPLYLGNSSFDLEDASGHLIKTEDMINTAPDYIYPGEKGYYYNQFGTSLNMTEEDFNSLLFVPHLKVVKVNGKLSTDYKLYDVTLGTDATFNIPEIVGRIKNNTKKELSHIYLHAFFYDSDGKIIGISGTNISDVAVGDEKSFSISTMYAGIQEGKTIADYKVYARGAYYQFK